jgi:hypothetical protein
MTYLQLFCVDKCYEKMCIYTVTNKDLMRFLCKIFLVEIEMLQSSFRAGSGSGAGTYKSTFQIMLEDNG